MDARQEPQLLSHHLAQPMSEKDIPRIKELLVSHYKSSTMNMWPPPPLPSMSDTPLKFSLKPDAASHAVYNPTTIPIPIHWQEDVQKQLARDIELGILEMVPTNEPEV